MTLSRTGAWFLGSYREGMSGTLGFDLDSDSDNLGWTLVAWKRELAYNGYTNLSPNTPVFGPQADGELKRFQKDHGLVEDGLLGPASGERILRSRIWQAEKTHALPDGILWKVTAQESNFDVGAVGYVDNSDRGAQQRHIYVSGGVQQPPLDQALGPQWSVPYAAQSLATVYANLGDVECAVASWNVGTGGATWWCEHGKPATGGPSWFPELGQRATEYVQLVMSKQSPTVV